MLLHVLLLPCSLLVTVGTPRSNVVMMGRKPYRAKPKTGGAAAAVGGGFGAAKKAPPTFDEVVGGWKTREPKDTSVTCPCGKDLSYMECCRPYHKGEKDAESPEWVLRSRYVAFAYRLPEYIIRTTHKTNADYMTDKIKWAKKLNKEQMFDSFEFKGLEVGDLEDGSSDDEQFLSLRVSLMPVDAAGIQKQPEPMVFTERSKFLRMKKGHWLYSAGEVRTEAVGFKDRVLNDQRDLDSMKADVDYVTKLIKDKTGKDVEA